MKEEKNEIRDIKNWPGWRYLALTTLLLVTVGVTLAGLIFINPTELNDLQLQVGKVAPQDILAPTAITYESEVLTEQQREAAARAGSPVHTPQDTQIARQQVDDLRAALTFITTVREDNFATQEQKIEDLAQVGNGTLDRETANFILSLNDSQWQTIQQEAIMVLQQIMRTTIREGQLEDARRSIPALVSFSITEEQAEVVTELVSSFVAPNSFFSEELTEARRQQARDAVEPVVRTFVEGETIVQRGQVITEADVEAMQQLGLLYSEDEFLDIAGAVALVILTSIFTILYLYREPTLSQDLRRLILIAFAFLLFLLGARFLIPGHTIIPYLYPVAGFSLLLGALFGLQHGMFLVIPLGLLITYGMPKSLELTTYYVLSSMFGVLMLHRAQRISSYFWGGIGVAALGAVTIVAYRLTDPFTDWIGILTLSGAALANGVIATGLTLLLQFFAAQWLGTTTALQLIEISRPDHPLLRYILLHAPGTYQHSLQVANLSEQAAERIGADPLLTRVGALYHDAGKALNPQYFIENQIPGTPNIHDSMNPEESAATIIKHVPGGVEMSRKYRLPKRIRDFILEHHGTMMTRYQYVRAVQEADGDESQVDPVKYQYPGPKPQSRETALVMLADGCEARARAEHPSTEEELKNMIKDTIDNYMAAAQLDETHLTARDLNKIIESFINTLKGIYHPRIDYPKLEKRTTSETSRESASDIQPVAQPIETPEIS